MDMTLAGWEQEHPQAARLLDALQSSLHLALHTYLSSCTLKEFDHIFAHFSRAQRKRLWNLYTQVVAAIDDNCQKQLWNTIRERQVAEFLLYQGEVERIGGGQDVTMSDGHDKLQAAQQERREDLTNKVKLVKERALKLQAENDLATALLEIRREEIRKLNEEVRQKFEAQIEIGADEVGALNKAYESIANYLTVSKASTPVMESYALKPSP